ncbi:hypothetical protein [Microlunatus sp. Gsoil 973]|uniref:hypothetical protein n=1 Tax=Microlunatus sp. Gsoil 973 TaxID=2672569 RepID=UPI0012B4F805|nr:hypothetical protein [Microlunatus sp. Gsoil 973]QGN31880.1 hypothetical protein GJV80_02580 [Microlunatus sp. Gsoil 973]
MQPSMVGGGVVPSPVFVDRSGRRRRLVKRIGIGVTILGVAYGAVLVSLSTLGVHIDAPGLPLVEQHSPVSAERPSDVRSGHVRSARGTTPGTASRSSA